MELDRRPTVSVGMPVYNAERFIEEALDSLLNQTLEDFEIIISDNASTDRTEAICRLYASRDERIRYIRNRQNYGVIENFNRVLRESSGKYFKWAASDDICDPDYLRDAVDILDVDPSIVLVWARTVGIDEAGTHVALPAEVSDLNSSVSVYSPDPVVRFRRLMRHLWWVDGPFYGVIRAEVLKDHLHPAHPSGDQILLTELSLQGRFYELSDVRFYSRVHAGKTSRVSTLSARAFLGEGSWGVRALFDLAGLVRGHLRRVAMYAGTISRASLTPAQKVRCYAEVAFAVGWWLRLRASGLLTGRLADLVRPSYPPI